MVGSARRAVPADAATLVDLDAAARATVAAERGGPLFLLLDARPLDLGALDDPDAMVVVGGIDDVTVGYAVVVLEPTSDGTRLAVLQALYVEPEGREIGVGEAMMDLVIDWSVQRGARGIDAVALPGDRATKNFFERYGLTARAILVHRPLGPAP